MWDVSHDPTRSPGTAWQPRGRSDGTNRKPRCLAQETTRFASLDRARIGRAALVSRGRGAGGPPEVDSVGVAPGARGLGRETFRPGRQRLARLAERWTNDGEVLFLLGNSEFELGKRDHALACWAKVPASSPFFGKAAVARASRWSKRAFIRRPNRSCSRPWPIPAASGRYELELALIRVYRYQGRFHDVRPLIRASWCRAPQPAARSQGTLGL